MTIRQMWLCARTACLVVGIVVLASSGISAFDGQRRGFNIGVGVGSGVVSYRPTWGKDVWDRQSKLAVLTDLRIGGAPSNHFQLYWMIRLAWFSADHPYWDVSFDRSTTTCHWSGLGISYYLKPQAPSPYLIGEAGMSAWEAHYRGETVGWTGLGLIMGVGYEFAAHLSAECSLAYATPHSQEYTLKALGVRLTLGYYAY
jgi:hypothetical protein